MSGSPELFGMLEDLKHQIQLLQTVIEPLRNNVKKFRLKTETSAQYLESKFLMVTTYCTYLSFYLVLKSAGRPVKTHPVIEQIVRSKKALAETELIDDKYLTQLRDLIQERSTMANKKPELVIDNSKILEKSKKKV
eukprot:TRINITY_DN5387_c0_g1_i1.p1 TRINITY_DN5387_c0_g1~~TRINITY_DN5387_c0_g1_i1.p1  ORF type:complete len:149 (+),score=37.24 TRINITY_DN5387_c0_g1_i1:40-447(+)